MTLHQCTCCKKFKQRTDQNFRRVSLKRKDMRFRQPCKECEKIKLKEYDQSPQGKLSKKRRDRNFVLSGGKAISDKKYYKKHKKRLIAVNVEKRRNDRINNPHIKMRDSIACLIRIILRKRGLVKTVKTHTYLGCDNLTFINHIKKKFKKGMNWKNYGQWHLDHIKPCASFDLAKPSEQKKCFHYTNLQPLWAKDNLSKGAKIMPTENQQASKLK